jgi:hypothetical protein
LSVTRRPAGERMVNEASIIYFQQGKDNVIHKVPLPDGYNTWAAGLKKGETVLWVAEKGALRQYDFADPLKIEETRYEGDESIEAPIPADVREALRGVLDAAETPKATPQKPATPAAD